MSIDSKVEERIEVLEQAMTDLEPETIDDIDRNMDEVHRDLLLSDQVDTIRRKKFGWICFSMPFV